MRVSTRRVANTALLVSLITVTATSPAFAQSVGTNLGGFIQNIVDLLTSNVIRGLAILAVMVLGITWFFGRLDLHRAGSLIVAIIMVFGASTIVDLITNGSGS